MKNKCLKTITVVAAVTAAISAAAIDSTSILPAVILSICFAWLSVFMEVNRDYFRRGVATGWRKKKHSKTK